jgi:hypothetical protein
MMIELYGYDTGPYEEYDFNNRGLRLNSRVDFNIDLSNKMTISFNHYQGSRDNTVSDNTFHIVRPDEVILIPPAWH